MRKPFRDQIERLALIEDNFCTSIYIPTHQYGQEVSQGKDGIVLKNQLKEVVEKLNQKGAPQDVIDAITNPINDLLDDTSFWNHQNNGLAILANPGGSEIIKLDESVEKHNSVSDRFYLVPLISQLEFHKEFLILALDAKNIRLFHATKNQIEDITGNIQDFPPKFRDVVGHDYEPASLQYRGQQEAQGHAMYHGHGGSDSDRKSEILQFFRRINEDIISFLRETDKPLIQIGQDYLLPIYQEGNQYINLVSEHVTVHPAELNDDEIREKAWGKIEHELSQEKNNAIEWFEEWQGTGKTSTNVKEIVEAAYQGRVDVLFVNLENNDPQGKFDTETGKVVIAKNDGGGSLINLAAVITFLKGGKIYGINSESESDQPTGIKATYRY